MVNRELTQSLNDSISSGSLQLGILLHQLLQSEAWKLYRNLGFFAFSFTLVHRALAIFGMSNSLPRTESALARRPFDWRPRQSEFLASTGEKLRDIFDRVVGAGGRSWFRRSYAALCIVSTTPDRALIFVFVRVVRGLAGNGASSRRTALGARPHIHTSSRPRRAQLFNQTSRDFFQETRGHARFRQIGTVAAAINSPAQDELIHRASHTHVAKAAL